MREEKITGDHCALELNILGQRVEHRIGVNKATLRQSKPFPGAVRTSRKSEYHEHNVEIILRSNIVYVFKIREVVLLSMFSAISVIYSS